MARKRMIDPSIWTDEGMAELTPRQQLLYIALFSNADDDGRLKGSPAAIALMLPTIYSARDRREIADDLTSVLATMNQLVKYEVDGREYLAFKNYRTWQKIDRPTDSILPPPPEKSPNPSPNLPRETSESDTAPGPFDDTSESDRRDVAPNRTEQNRREGNNGADAPDRSPSSSRSPNYSAEFEAFWSHFPRGKGNKKKTWDQWKRLRPDDDLQTEIIERVEAWKKTRQWREGFVTHAERWLRDRGWEDDLPEDDPALRVVSGGQTVNGVQIPDHLFGQERVEYMRRMIQQEERHDLLA